MNPERSNLIYRAKLSRASVPTVEDRRAVPLLLHRAYMNAENAKLLLIEDNPRDAELTLNALRGHPLAGAIRIARDGQEALDLLFGGPDDTAATIPAPKIILLDLRLPKVNGLEVLQRIRSEPRTRDIPVIVLISTPHERDIVERHGHRVKDYILKPGDFDDFTRAIRAIDRY